MSTLEPPTPPDHKPFYVIWQDFNAREFEPYDVMEYFLHEWQDLKKKRRANKPTNMEELKRWLDDQARYMFWARCEYEVILAGWPNMDTRKKIDIYDQIKMNLDTVVEIFAQNIKFKSK